MSEKDKALAHLSEIKSALVDKDAFFPYNYNALIVWGVIGIIMSFVMPSMIVSSLLWGTVLSVVLMGICFIVEGFLTKRVNEDYDIDNCTKRQKFIATTFTILTLFSIILTVLFAKHMLITPLFMIWLFAIGFGDHVVGYVLNIKLFSMNGYLSMASSMILLILSLFVDDLGSIDSVFFYLCQGVSFVMLGIVPILIGLKLKRQDGV